MANTFSPSNSVLYNLSKKQTAKVVPYNESYFPGSSLNNTNIPGQIQYQFQSGSRNNGGSSQLVVVVQPIHTPSIHEIKTYLRWSILNIICCCWLLGSVACWYSMLTDALKMEGNIPGALKASKRARNVNIIGTIFSVIIISCLIYVLYNLLNNNMPHEV